MFLAQFYFASFQDALENLQKGGIARRLTTSDAIIVAAVGVAVVGLIFIWAIFIRKPAKPEKHPLPRSSVSEDEGGEQRRRRRRRRRAHRPRNPTLHQTGGLPPPRPDDVPPAA